MNLDGIAPQGNRELRVDSYYKEERDVWTGPSASNPDDGIL
jgi:hypothetical protein